MAETHVEPTLTFKTRSEAESLSGYLEVSFFYEGKKAGYMLLAPNETFVDLDLIYVHPSVRGIGVATVAMRRLFAYAFQKGLGVRGEVTFNDYTMTADAIAARVAFFGQLGFKASPHPDSVGEFVIEREVTAADAGLTFEESGSS